MSDLAVLIRPYQAADWPQLCAIHDAARLDELRASVGVAAFLTLEQTGEAEGLFAGQVAVAEVADKVVGFVAYTSTDLTWLYVDPNHYGRGIGRKLVRHAIEQAGPVLQLEVLEGNAAALQLYLSEGFTVVKRVEGRLAGNETFSAVGYLLERSATTFRP